MKGNLYTDMAYAVENAFTMIVCVSKPYFESENCINEFTYGHGSLTTNNAKANIELKSEFLSYKR